MAGPLRKDKCFDSTSSGTSVTPTFGSTPAVGDILLAALTWNGAGAVTTPSGWTALASVSQTNLTLAVFWKVSNGTETNVVLAVAGAATLLIGEAGFYDGSDPVTGATHRINGLDTSTMTATDTQSDTGTFTNVPNYSRSIVFASVYKADATARTASDGSVLWDEVVGSDLNVNNGSNKSYSMVWEQDSQQTGSYAGPTLTWTASATVLNAVSFYITRRQGAAVLSGIMGL